MTVDQLIGASFTKWTKWRRASCKLVGWMV